MRITPVIGVMLLSVPFLAIRSSAPIIDPPTKQITTAVITELPKKPPVHKKKPVIVAAVPHSGVELHCLAKNIYFEARGEPLEGQKAVARVTYNRKRVLKMDSLCDVVYHKAKGTCAFSWVCQGYSEPKHEEAWRRAIRVAEDFLRNPNCCAGLEKALYFHADYITPLWAAERAFIRQIGTHLFYK